MSTIPNKTMYGTSNTCDFKTFQLGLWLAVRRVEQGDPELTSCQDARKHSSVQSGTH